MNYYQILGISENASKKEIKKAYRSKSKQYHPDLYDGDKVFAEEMMKQINIAYDVLYNGKVPYKPPPPEASKADKSGVSDNNEPCFTDDESDLEQENFRQDSEEENVQTFEQEKKLPKILSYVVIIGVFFVFPPVGQIISVILFIIRYLIQLFNFEKVQINNGFVVISLFLSLMLFCNSNVDNIRMFGYYLYGWAGAFQEKEVSQANANSPNESVPPEGNIPTDGISSPQAEITFHEISSLAGREPDTIQAPPSIEIVASDENMVEEFTWETGELYYDQTNDYYYYA